MVALGTVTAAMVVREQIIVTSDLAALAAASAQLGLADGVPCDRARQIVDRAGLLLAACEVVGEDTVVTVTGSAAAIRLEARSRAGPAPLPENLLRDPGPVR